MIVVVGFSSTPATAMNIAVCGSAEEVLAQALATGAIVRTIGSSLSGSTILVPANEIWLANGDTNLVATAKITIQGALLTHRAEGVRADGGSIALQAPTVEIFGAVATASGADGTQVTRTVTSTTLTAVGESGYDGGAILFQTTNLVIGAASCIGTGSGGLGQAIIETACEVLRGGQSNHRYEAGSGGSGGDLQFSKQHPDSTFAGAIFLGNGGHGGEATASDAAVVQQGTSPGVCIPDTGRCPAGQVGIFDVCVSVLSPCAPPQIGVSGACVTPPGCLAGSDSVSVTSGTGGDSSRSTYGGQPWPSFGIYSKSRLDSGIGGNGGSATNLFAWNQVCDAITAILGPLNIDGDHQNAAKDVGNCGTPGENGENGKNGSSGGLGAGSGEPGGPAKSPGGGGAPADATGLPGGEGTRHGGNGGSATAAGGCGGRGGSGGNGGNGGRAAFDDGDGGKGGDALPGGPGGSAAANAGKGGNGAFGNGGDGGTGTATGGNGACGGDGGHGGAGETPAVGGVGAPGGALGGASATSGAPGTAGPNGTIGDPGDGPFITPGDEGCLGDNGTPGSEY